MGERPLPIGIDDFREVIEDGYYHVDKSLFIKELMDNGGKAVLLLRPRRFGKTLNLSMLRWFFEQTQGDTGRLFRGLAIQLQGEAYMRHQGRYPVISLTFKEVAGDDWAYSYGTICDIIAAEYERHRELLQSPKLTDNEKRRIERIINLDAEPYEVGLSLKRLSEYLAKAHGRRVLIFVDEYDAPIQRGYLRGYYDQAVSFMRGLLSGALKGNAALGAFCSSAATSNPKRNPTNKNNATAISRSPTTKWSSFTSRRFARGCKPAVPTPTKRC